jgi:hypothetical protein
MTDRIERATRLFGKAYHRSKRAETEKSKRQAQFFAAATDSNAHQVLGQRLIPVPADNTGEGIKTHLQRFHPGWRYVSQDEHNILIEEDPALLKFQYINLTDGYVYGRTIVEPGPSLDDEQLRAEQPELWSEISFWPEPWYTLVSDALRIWTPSVTRREIDLFLERFFTNKGIPRTLSDPSSWTEEQVEQVSQYMVPGPITTRLVPPRKATPEELGEV